MADTTWKGAPVDAGTCPEGHPMEGDDDACYPTYSPMAHCVAFHRLAGCPAFPSEADIHPTDNRGAN